MNTGYKGIFLMVNNRSTGTDRELKEGKVPDHSSMFFRDSCHKKIWLLKDYYLNNLLSILKAEKNV